MLAPGPGAPAPSPDALAAEIGINAHEYLEECFHHEVSVLDRDKFDAIPEIVKEDLTIVGHLGKGSFSDVFEVVCDGLVEDEALDDLSAPPKTPPRSASTGAADAPSTPGPGGLVRRRSSRRGNPLGGSLSSRTLARPSPAGDPPRRPYAMKCLRPSVRADPEQFMVGSEDLVHETALLANLSHDHVIRLHARAAGRLADAFVLNDGYFILLDVLAETLHEQMAGWRDDNAGGAVKVGVAQAAVAADVADAMAYLHTRRIVFRDLKPANVGFDGQGVLKLFDFGFAIGLPEPEEGNPAGLLHDRCGTPRYMAPEVGLSRGYGLPADVYSFGMLLWEMCALERPFADITTAEEFDDRVFKGGLRPGLGAGWPKAARDLTKACWAAAPDKRPGILDVRARAAAWAASAPDKKKKKSTLGSLRASLTLMRRQSNDR